MQRPKLMQRCALSSNGGFLKDTDQQWLKRIMQMKMLLLLVNEISERAAFLRAREDRILPREREVLAK